MTALPSADVQATYRFHLVGNARPVELEVAAPTMDDLYAMLSCQRFVQGRTTEAEGDGALLNMLIATSRIQCVVEAA